MRPKHPTIGVMKLTRDPDRWWPLLSESSREWLQAGSNRPLPADVLADLVRVRGYGPPSAYWIGSDDDGAARFFLTANERNWIARHVNS